MRPADAARKKIVKSFQNVARNLSWEPAVEGVGRRLCQNDAVMRDQYRRGKPRRADHGRQAGKCETHSDPVEPQAKSRCSQHGTERKKTDEIAVDQSRPGERRRIHALLHHDVGHPAAGSEQHAVAEDEPTQGGCDGRQGYASAGKAPVRATRSGARIRPNSRGARLAPTVKNTADMPNTEASSERLAWRSCSRGTRRTLNA